MPLFSLPLATPYPSPTIIPAGDPVRFNNLRRKRFTFRARALTHNASYVLTFASWGLTVAYQVQLVELQLKVRNCVGFVLPIFVAMSDPRVACLHEASAPVLFVAWISLSLEWYVAYSDIPADGELRYVPRVGCVEGSSPCTILFWYLVCTFSISICFFAEFVVILTLQHGPQFRAAIKSHCARLWEALARTRITNNSHSTAVAAPVQNDVESERQYEGENQSTVYTTVQSSTSAPNAPGHYHDLNTANLTWLTMVHAQESEDQVIPYYVYGQDSLPSAIATTAPSIEIETATLIPTAATTTTSNVFVASTDVAAATTTILITVSAPAAAAEERLQVLSTVPSVSQISTCYALDFGPQAHALFREQMGFDTSKLNKTGKSSTAAAAASHLSSGSVNRRNSAGVDAVEDAAAAVVTQPLTECDYDTDISDNESFSVSEVDETNEADYEGEQVVPVAAVVGAVGVAAATAEGTAFGAVQEVSYDDEKKQDIADQVHLDYNWDAYFQRHPNAWLQQYKTEMRVKMSWLAQWDSRPRGNAVHKKRGGDDGCLEEIPCLAVEVETSSSTSPSSPSPSAMPSPPSAR
ncbi:hypothetical protein BGZ95_002038 [Linnemannia exigua]|uniref:Uncharacterized protein n=1 Tax=Linnemannia exigua TaxID=604196 RepID=A0AAD4HAP9_9FUNG|nr:hypothetical protein BGZ95_002038 [Linnemannia exigua]